MILELTLEHTKEKGRRQTLEIFDVDAGGVARIALEKGVKGVETLVHGIIHQKLPKAFSSFRVVSWNFRDRQPSILV